MRKSEKLNIIKNIGSSWFALGANVAIGIFLSPFILHRLGDAAFGIWVLIFSITGYYGIFDLGIRSSIVRYVSKFSATDDRENLARVINTTLFGYSCIGLFTLIVTVAGMPYLDLILKIPPSLQQTSRWLFLIVGASVALGFPLGVFGGALEGLQRYYLVNWMNVVSTVIRAGLIVVFLSRGGGLLALGLVTTIVPFVASLLRMWVALWILKTPIRWRFVTRDTARLVANYSGLTFLILISSRLRFQTDEIIIGNFLSTEAITHFSIGARLVDYANNVILCVAQIFMPMSSQSDAQGDTNRLRKMLIAGNRACAFVILPISATLVILGKSVIEVWVGAKYIPQSYPVLLVLLIPFTFMLAQAASSRMLLGIGQHRTYGIVTIVEGVVNIVLSVILVRYLGIVGDALGTAIPLGCTTILFLPWYACRTFGVKLGTFLKHTFALPLAGTVPLLLTLLLEQRWFVPHKVLPLLLQVAIGWSVFGIFLLWLSADRRVLRIDGVTTRSGDEPVVLAQESAS